MNLKRPTTREAIRDHSDEAAAELVKAKLEELCALINRFPDLVFQYGLTSQYPVQIVNLNVYRQVMQHRPQPPQAAQTTQ